jgi:hydrogenase expression/formation protein HypE
VKEGKISNKILKRTVLKNMGDSGSCVERAVCEGMGATVLSEGVFSGGSRLVMSTESGIEPVIKAYNNVCAKAAVPKLMQVSVTLPTRDREIRLREITSRVAQDCRLMEVDYIGGHTQVSADVSKAVISATCIGEQISLNRKNSNDEDTDTNGIKITETNTYTGTNIRPGDIILLTKWIGIGGVRKIIEEKRNEISGRYRDEVIDTAYGKREYMMIGEEAKLGARTGVSYMLPLSYGGVYAGLNDLADLTGYGFDVDFRKIPVCQEIIEICEMYDINPYELESSGCLLMTFAPDCDIIKLLYDEGIPAHIIGKVAEGERNVHNLDDVYHLEYTSHDEIYKI